MLTANQLKKVAVYYLLMSFLATALNVTGFATKEALQGVAALGFNLFVLLSYTVLYLLPAIVAVMVGTKWHGFWQREIPSPRRLFFHGAPCLS